MLSRVFQNSRAVSKKLLSSIVELSGQLKANEHAGIMIPHTRILVSVYSLTSSIHAPAAYVWST